MELTFQCEVEEKELTCPLLGPWDSVQCGAKRLWRNAAGVKGLKTLTDVGEAALEALSSRLDFVFLAEDPGISSSCCDWVLYLLTVNYMSFLQSIISVF